MALTYPLDLLADFPGHVTEFELVWRQEQSRQASGRTIGKDFGSPIWRLSAVSRQMWMNELDQWRARLDALEGGQKTFRGYAMSRARPIQHPGFGGDAPALPDTAYLHTINANRKAIRVDGLNGISLSVGDMISIDGRDVHRVMEAVTAVAGLTPLFEIRPHLWADVVTDLPVSIDRPSCVMAVDIGSVKSSADPQTGRGTISFTATEARD
jgi:hypothetical protein